MILSMDQKNWLQRLQESDDRTKKRWLVGLSAASMIIVVAVWLSYFATLVAVPGGGVTTESKAPQGVSFFDTMKTGSGVIFDYARNGLRRLSDTLKAPRSYIIKP